MNNPFFDPQNQTDQIFNNDDFEKDEKPSEQTVKTLKKIYRYFTKYRFSYWYCQCLDDCKING